MCLKFLRPVLACLLAIGLVSPAMAGDEAASRPITLSFDVSAYPFSYLDRETGEEAGFDVDLVKAIAKAEGLDIVTRTMPFDGMIPSLQAGMLDVAVDAFGITASRMDKVLFSNAYYLSGLSILVRKDSPVETVADLKGLVVGTQKATTSVDYLKRQGVDVKHIKLFSNISFAYQSLVTGGVDAVVYDDPMNRAFIKTGHDSVKVVGGLLDGEYCGIAVSRKRPDLVARFNAGLAKIRANGQYKALFDKWFDGNTRGAVDGVVTPEEAVAKHES